jgi:hypothetical protein
LFIYQASSRTHVPYQLYASNVKQLIRHKAPCGGRRNHFIGTKINAEQTISFPQPGKPAILACYTMHPRTKRSPANNKRQIVLVIQETILHYRKHKPFKQSNLHADFTSIAQYFPSGPPKKRGRKQ